jgi:hypothetical protein
MTVNDGLVLIFTGIIALLGPRSSEPRQSMPEFASEPHARLMSIEIDKFPDAKNTSSHASRSLKSSI